MQTIKERLTDSSKGEALSFLAEIEGLRAVLGEDKTDLLLQEIREYIEATWGALGVQVEIAWEGRVEDVRKGKPYFAILTGAQGKIVYEFVSTLSYDSRKGNSGATAVYTGSLPEGTVVRYREGASWKNDYSYYAVVSSESDGGLRKISEINAKRMLGIIK